MTRIAVDNYAEYLDILELLESKDCVIESDEMNQTIDTDEVGLMYLGQHDYRMLF